MKGATPRVPRWPSQWVVMVASATLACGSSPTEPSARTQQAHAVDGRSLTAALDVAVAAGLASLTPHRCTALVGSPQVVTLTPQDGRVRVAVFAELREVTPASLAQVKAFLADATVAPLSALVLLGSNAATVAEARSLLDAVASPAYPTVVVPGDREPVSGLRDLIATHPQRATLIDATRPTAIDAGVARLILVGGMPTAAQLAWRVDGCVYEPADVEALRREVEAWPIADHAITPWLAALVAAPVRGEVDVGATAIHVGDARLASALAAVPIVVFAGAEHATRDGAWSSEPQKGAPPRHIALGHMSAQRRYDSEKQPQAGKALLLTVSAGGAKWQVWAADAGTWEQP
ncbi:MAG: hypothetical protein IPL79_11980 [Myxococcales bacterium]|nr:hypothetical protein [Myxococcales bacterium]